MAPAPDRRRAAALAVGLVAGWVALTLASFATARAGLGGGDYRGAALLATAVLALAVTLALSRFGLWRRAGFTPWRDWQARGLFLVPALLVLMPLARGFGPVEALPLPLLVTGYALTGFAEEGFFRGLLPEVLRPLDPLPAAALSSVLFGAAHLSNILIRGEPGIILAQALGAACFGFGYAALRWRTGTLVPLIALHFLTDLFLQLGALPLIPVAVAQDVVLLGLGFVLLAPRRRGAA